MQRRTFTRKEIRLPCAIEVAGASPLQGQTRDISPDGVSGHFPGMMVPGRRLPKLGDTGVLTLSAPPGAMSRQALKIPCRVAHVTGNVIGLQINTQLLTLPQRETFAAIMR